MSTRNEAWLDKKEWLAIAVGIALLLVMAGLLTGLSEVGNRSESRERLSNVDETEYADDSLDSDAEVETDSDEHLRDLVVGTWEDDYQGHRTLIIRGDGTATMVVELEGLAATLYAKRMTFEEEWTIKGGRLTLKTVGGEPERSVKLITNVMGNVSEQKILELTADRMLLLDADGTTEYDWRRVRVDASPTPTRV